MSGPLTTPYFYRKLRRMQNEIWRAVPGYLNYAVSDQGRWMNTKKNRVMPSYPGTRGEQRVVLHKNCTAQYWALHRLVASLYLPDWDPELQVEHIDGDKNNCAATNLRMSDIGAH